MRSDDKSNPVVAKALKHLSEARDLLEKQRDSSNNPEDQRYCDLAITKIDETTAWVTMWIW